MSAFDRLRQIGEWWRLRTITQAELEAMDAMRPAVLNGLDGSTHEPSAPIIVGGAGIHVPVDPDHVDSATRKGYVDRLSQWARYQPTNGAPIQEAGTGLTAIHQATGFSIGGTSNREITVPENGDYFVCGSVLVREITDTSNPLLMGVFIAVGGTLQIPGNPQRFSGSTSDVAIGIFNGIVTVTDRTTQKIVLYGSAGQNLQVIGANPFNNTLFVKRVG
jgi:hypothetical protein